MSRSSDLTAGQVRDLLQLEASRTRGFVRATHTGDRQLAPGALAPPLAAARPVGSALYFLVTPQAPVRLHRIQNDQLYPYYPGDPLELVLMKPDGSRDRVTVGPDIANGQQVQFFIPGGSFHTARVAGSRRWFPGGSTGWPGTTPRSPPRS